MWGSKHSFKVPTSFPHPIPAGTAIPDWAFIPIDGFVSAHCKRPARCLTCLIIACHLRRCGRYTDKLESTGTAQPTAAANSQSPGTDSASVTGSATTAGTDGGGIKTPAAMGPQASASSVPSGSSDNIGGVVGGVIGGLVGFAILAGLVVYFCVLRGRRGRATVAKTRRRTRTGAGRTVDPQNISRRDDPELATDKDTLPPDVVDSLPSVTHTPPPIVPDVAHSRSSSRILKIHGPSLRPLLHSLLVLHSPRPFILGSTAHWGGFPIVTRRRSFARRLYHPVTQELPQFELRYPSYDETETVFSVALHVQIAI
ncbi:hypothetical protein BV20DRAFT_961096, partial [Pilatotrama ljubarskyi]